MRILTYNIQSGVGIDGVRSVERIAEMLIQLRADLVGLQEVELGSPRSHFQNQPRVISEVSRLGYAFGHGFQRGPWRFGNVILSRFPIQTSTRHSLPSKGEKRSMLVTRVGLTAPTSRVSPDPAAKSTAPKSPPRKPDVKPSTPPPGIHVCCTHLGLDRDERIKQVEAICRIVDALHGPLLLVGDFNDTPNSPPIARILEAGFVDAAGPSPTFMAPNPREKIDYLFTRGFAAVGSPQVVPSLFSDHLPVWAEVEIAAEKKETSPEPAT